MTFRRLLRYLTENWTLKLAALALALLLWLAVRAGAPKRTTFRNVPVTVDLRDPDWRLAEPPHPGSVTVTVTGPTGELMTLAGSPPTIVLPVERVSDSIETQVLPTRWVRLPRGLSEIRIEGIRPDTIELRYERLTSRLLPVRVTTRGQLPDGLVLVLPVSTNPALVEVRGAAADVAALDSVPLLPVELGGLRATTNVPAQVDTAALEDVTVIPSELNVILRVAPDSLVAPAQGRVGGSGP